MTNDNIFNVSSEFDSMKNYISDIDYCTSKVKEVNDYALVYHFNHKTNIMTILATAYALICAVLQFNAGLICIGVLFAFVLIMSPEKNKNNGYKISCMLNIAIIISAIIFFMIYYTFIPILIILTEWIYVIICNFKLKNQIWEISNNL